MAKTLLRSGCLDDFQSTGGGGQAVFTSALQIRETLRLKKQQGLVDCLAIPQRNDEGDRVDWYSPVEGLVVPWKTADENQRANALQQLARLAESVKKISKHCVKSDRTAQQLFGALLANVLQFPGENHVFLVDLKPVITFWGFVKLNENPRDLPFECLQSPATAELPAPQESILPLPEPLSAAPRQTDTTLLTALNEILPQPEPAEEPQPITEEPVIETLPRTAIETTPGVKTRRFPLWSLPVAAVLIAMIGAPLFWSSETTLAEPVAASAPHETAPVIFPVLNTALPVQPASIIEPVKIEKPQDKSVVVTAIPKDTLVMETDQIRAGTTRFLNGNWRVLGDIKDTASGKTPSIRYQIQNNKGSARLVHGNNIVCRVDIFSGLHQNGELQIKSRGHARCSDGSRYPLPQITCKAGANGVAQCTGRYDTETSVPLTLRKVGA